MRSYLFKTFSYIQQNGEVHMSLSEQMIEHWKQYRDDMFEDKTFVRQRHQRESERHDAVKEMNETLQAYLSGNLDNNAFRDIFQKKTTTDWDSFGLKGFSGAMFLNMLVNNVPDQDEVERQLKRTLPAPNDPNEAYQRMADFMNFLQNLRRGKVAKRKIQPAHAPFFVSAWWHVQNMETWPIYYISARKALNSEGVYTTNANEPVDDYFSFREVFISLRNKLDLHTWEMEHLCVWLREQKEVSKSQVTYTSEANKQIPKTTTATQDKEDEVIESTQHSISHTQVQLLLAKIGRTLGCDIWIARNDHSRMWDGERLGDYSLRALPPYIVAESQAQNIIELIDVIWLKGSRGVAAAFEIEHTTSIYSGMLRMSDLLTLQPNLAFPLYIVTSQDRLAKVKQQLSRPTFQALQLHETCGFFSYEELIEEAPNIMRWAKRPETIENLAEYVPTILEH